jgi:hypothetical protein
MTDFLDTLERQLIGAAAAPHGQSLPATRTARRLTPLAVAAAVVLGATAVALAAAGLLTGSPVRPSGPLSPTAGAGIPAAGGSRLLPVRIADPAGGPPWGLRLVHTSRGYLCLQVGRVHNGVLGELGIDGAFNDDGRFHPLPADVLPPTGFAIPSSCVVAGQTFTATRINVDRNATPPSGLPVLQRNQRVVAFGLLGAHALSVSYDVGGRQHTTSVAPGSGAYLVVEGGSKRWSGQGTMGSEGLDGLRALPNGALNAIAYRFGGTVCSDSRDLHNPHACPTRPVRIRQPRERNLHRPLHVTLDIRHNLIYGAQLSFTAPYAVTSARESYAIQMTIPRGCHGTGGVSVGGINRNVARGSTVRVDLPYVFADSCNRFQAISIVFRRIALPPKSIHIGTITIHEPAGTRAAPPPVPQATSTK